MNDTATSEGATGRRTECVVHGTERFGVCPGCNGTLDRLRAIEAAARAAEPAMSTVVGTLGYYIGPSARTATSREDQQRFAAVVAARDALREALR